MKLRSGLSTGNMAGGSISVSRDHERYEIWAICSSQCAEAAMGYGRGPLGVKKKGSLSDHSEGRRNSHAPADLPRKKGSGNTVQDPSSPVKDGNA